MRLEDIAMSYIRVIPRDLFNEASLLKCYGALWIILDDMGPHNHGARFDREDVARFEIEQEEGSGALYIANLGLWIGARHYRLSRPLNSRQPWPLYAIDDDDEATAVFDDTGHLSAEMARLIGATE